MNKWLIWIAVFATPLLASAQQPNWSKTDQQLEDSIAIGAFEGAQKVAFTHLEEVKALKNDTILAKLYFTIALGHLYKEINQALIYSDSAIQLSSKAGYNKLTIRTLGAKSTFFRKLGKYDSAKSMSYKAYMLGLQHNSLGLFQNARNLSIVYRELNQYDSALYYLLVADSLAQISADPYQKYLSTQGIANIYLDMGKFRQAISKNKELLRLNQRKPNQMNTLLNLGNGYEGLGKLDSAVAAFEQSLVYAKELTDTIETANIYGRLGEVYYKKQDYKTAEKQIEQALFYAAADKPKDIIASALLTLAKVKYELKDYKKAISSAQEALKLAEELSIVSQKIEALGVLHKSYNKTGDHRQAYNYLTEYEKVKSEFNDKERQATVEELQTKYETAKKEQAISALTKENEIKDLQLSRQSLILLSSILLAILVISFVFVLFRQFRLKSKQKQLLLEQSLLRTQMNPHFIFNALTSIQNFVLDKDEKNASRYLTKFGQLMRDILESSREELVPLSREVQMLKNYVELEEARFKKHLDFQVSANELDQDEVLVPPMMIQPFIENSIKHGFDGKEEGVIHLEFTSKDNFLHVVLKDNGSGIKEAVDSEQSKKSLAITIARERLANQGIKSSLDVSNIKNPEGSVLGFQVSFKLPLKYAY